MASPWQPYIPYPVTQDLLEQFSGGIPGAGIEVGRLRRFEAVVLFADISGFTALSEALGAVGKEGSEQLTDLLNRYFDAMIALIQSYGGTAVKFGGDAITVLFPFSGAARAAVIARAVQCAVEMQARMGAYAALSTRAGVFGLAMKAGLALGPVLCTTIGDPAIRLEYVIAGSTLELAAAAEHHAGAGEVVAHARLTSALTREGVACAAEKMGGNFVRLTGLKTPVSPQALPPLPALPVQAEAVLMAYLHPSVAQRLREGSASFVNEHRKVTILFVSFSNFDYDHDPQVGQKLQTYLVEVVRVLQRYDGYLNKVDMGDKGSKILALFGAPIAHENDVVRALLCALELRALSGADVPAAVAIGVNTGFVYSGLVGSEARREYTVMGDAVNLAARLMQAAEAGQVLVSQACRHLCRQVEGRERFEWGEGLTLKVKGKTEPVPAYPLNALSRQDAPRLQEMAYALPMVGRRAELVLAQDRLERARRGQGQIVGITAEPGMGKSRLAAEIIRLALEGGFAGFGGECQSYGAQTSYLVWQGLLRDFFGLHRGALHPVAGTGAGSLALQQRHLEARLAQVDPAFVQRAPLLGLALNLPLPDTDLTRSLSAQGADGRIRKEALEALVVACLRQRAQQTPLLLVLEDCHWIDPLSNDLLAVVGRNLADLPALMLVIYRSLDGEASALRAPRFGHFTEIRLQEFSRPEAEALIQLKVARRLAPQDETPVSPTVEQAAGEQIEKGWVDRIVERAQGNPFYIEEMINLIRDRGLDPADAQALDLPDSELPDSLHSLIISRIDQLAEETKTTLKVASVIGRTFRASWLWGIYPELGAPELVKQRLTQLHHLDITPLDKPEPELEYLFKNIVTREVAYESLALGTRAMLHEQTGRYIEILFPQDTDRYLDLLAHHFGLSNDQAKQREYFRRAGQAAQSAYANEAAIAYYQRLLPLLPEAEQGEILLAMGRVRQLTGKWAEAEQLFRQALGLAEKLADRRGMHAAAQHAIGALLRMKGVCDEAMTWLEAARAGYAALADPVGQGEALKEIGIAHWSQAEYPQALACFEQCQAIALQTGDQHGLYRAIGNMGLVHKIQGDLPKALACYEQSYRIASDLNDRLGASIAVGNLGNMYLTLGDYGRALSCYTQKLQLSLELGFRMGIGIAVENMGNLYDRQGDTPATLACQALNLQIALELGDWLGMCQSLWSLAETYIAMQRYEPAQQALEKSLLIGRALDMPDQVCEARAIQGDLLIRLGQYAAAAAALDEAQRIAAEIDYPEVRFKAQAAAVRLQALRGQIGVEAAIAAWLALLPDEADPSDQALSRREELAGELAYEIWRLDAARQDYRQQAAAVYRKLYTRTPNVLYKQRFEQLTGERLPDPPPLPPLPELVTAQVGDQSQARLEKLLALVTARLPEIGG